MVRCTHVDVLVRIVAFIVSIYFAASSVQAQTGCSATPTFQTYGSGTQGSNGVPVITVNAVANVGTAFSLRVSNGLPGAFLCVVAGETESPIFYPDAGGYFYPGQPAYTDCALLDETGASPLIFNISAIPQEFCGIEFTVQAMVVDPGAAASLALSAPVKIRVGTTSSGGTPPAPEQGPPAPVISSYVSLTKNAIENVAGTAPGAATVSVVHATGTQIVAVTNDQFGAAVPIAANKVNKIYISAVSATGAFSAPSTATITNDNQGPDLFIDFPPPNVTLLTTQTVDIAGRVGDVLSGFAGLTVKVNNIDAVVDIGIGSNGTYVASAVPLNADSTPTAIVVSAKDSLGNETIKQTVLTYAAATGAKMEATAGNGQQGIIDQYLLSPVEVRMTQLDGVTPFENKIVTFKVIKSNGRVSLTGGGDPGNVSIQVHTDANGFARAYWKLGTDAGCGNNRVSVESNDIAGTIFYCASALAGRPKQINIGFGSNQKAIPGAPAPEHLKVWVNDGMNGTPQIDVTFTVTQGDGRVDGQLTKIVATSPTGHAEVAFTLGPDPGTNKIVANFTGNAGLPVEFAIEGIEQNFANPTTFTGLVLDNTNRLIQGADCYVLVSNNIIAQTPTDANGKFLFSSLPVAGPALLYVNGLTATHVGGPAPAGEDVPAGSFPALAYETIIIPNTENSLSTSVLLPALDPVNAKVFDNTQDAVLTINGMEGLTMTVKAGSMTMSGGVVPNTGSPVVVALNQVHFDKVPMPIPNGAAPPFAWTLQPAGAHFNPPVEVRMPNMAGLPAGGVMYFLSFNHDTNQFEIVASGHVSDDGAICVSDPGAGISTAGWGGFCPPYPQPTKMQLCAETSLWDKIVAGAKLVIDIASTFTKISAIIDCGANIATTIHSAVSDWQDAKADGVITTQEKLLLTLNIGTDLKNTFVACSAIFTPSFSPCTVSEKLEKVNDGFSAAVKFGSSICLTDAAQTKVSGALGAVGGFLSLINSACEKLSVKQALLAGGCFALEEIIAIFDLAAPSVTSDGDSVFTPEQIAQLDVLFGQLNQSATDMEAVDADFAMIVNNAPDVNQFAADLDFVKQELTNDVNLAGCEIRIGPQTTIANEGGGFSITNIPSNLLFTNVTAVCRNVDPPLYGESAFFDLVANQTLTFQSVAIPLSATPPPAPRSLSISAQPSILTQLGQTTQLATSGNMSNNTIADLTLKSTGTLYTSTNGSIISVSQDGLATANAPGLAYVMGSNRGVTTTRAIQVLIDGSLKTVEGFVQLENGTPVAGANVSIQPGFAETTTSPQGYFSVASVPASEGNISVFVSADVAGIPNVGTKHNLTAVSAGITDAGIIKIKPGVYWKTDVSGNWNDGTKWSTNAVPTATDDVIIDRPNGNFTITINSAAGNIIVKSLKCTEKLTLTGGSLKVTQPYKVDNTLTLSGGSLVGSTLFGSATNVGVTGSSSAGSLDAMVLYGGILLPNGAVMQVKNGLALYGTATLASSGSSTRLEFFGTQTLSGTGDVFFSGSSANQIGSTSGTLTIGNAIEVHGGAGQVGIAGSSVINSGTISADTNNQAISLTINLWQNTGTIQAKSGGILNIGGVKTSAEIGTVLNSGGVINYTGTVTNNGTMVISGAGTWNLNGGTITGGTLDIQAGASLNALANSSNKLSGVTVNGNINMTTTLALLVIQNGLTLNGTLLMNATQASVGFLGNQTVSGNATIQFGGVVGTLPGLGANGAATVTLSPTVTIAGGYGQVGVSAGYGSALTLINQGTILSNTSGLTLTINASSFTNSGTLATETNGKIQINPSFTQTGGSIALNTGTLQLSGTATLAGGTLAGVGTVIGNITNSAEVAPGSSAGTLTITGNYTQTSTGILTIELGGTTAGTQHDRLSVSGTVSLAGTAALSLINSYVPNLGDMFTILSSGTLSGTFTTITGDDAAPGILLQPAYSNAGVTFTAVSGT